MQAQFRVFIPRDDYPYLLRYLRRRFGPIMRMGNDFWAAEGQPRVVASLTPDGQVILPTKNPFAPEVISLKEIINEERRYRIIKIHKVLHYCSKCLSFFISAVEMTQHLTNGEVHPIEAVGEYTYTKYTQSLPPLEQRKGWIPREALLRTFSKYVGPDAEKMADLRIISFREGIPLSVQEMVKGAKIPDIVYERYAAYRDELEARMVPPVRAKKSFSSLSTPTTQDLPTTKPQTFKTLLSSFINWRVKIDGVTLTPEQMLQVASRLGLPIDNGDHYTATTTHTTDVDDFIKVVNDAAKDEDVPTSLDKLAVLVKRDKRLASAVRRARDVARYKPSWKGQKSIRYSETKAEGKPVVPLQVVKPTPAQPTTPPADPEKEKLDFMEKFSLKPADLIEQNGLIKAIKMITTQHGTWRVTIYNTVFTHRLIAPSEFPARLTQIAQEIASNTGGTLAVAEDRKRGFKSLVVVVDGKYTVRVASKPLSPSRNEKYATINH